MSRHSSPWRPKSVPKDPIATPQSLLADTANVAPAINITPLSQAVQTGAEQEQIKAISFATITPAIDEDDVDEKDGSDAGGEARDKLGPLDIISQNDETTSNGKENDGTSGDTGGGDDGKDKDKDENARKNWPIFRPLDGPYPLSVYKKDYIQIKNEILVGIVVGCAQVPESVAFAFLAGVDPGVGLHAAWIIGFIVAFSGNRPGLISGATGAMAAILMDPIAEHGISYLFYTVILKGIIQTAISFMGFEKVANLVPYTTNIGFVNGLAIIIGLSQINNFKIPESREDEFPDGDTFVTGATLLCMILLSLLTFGIIEILPKFTKIVPSSLVAISVCAMIEHLILRPTGIAKTTLIGDISSLSGGFPKIIFADNLYKDNLPSLLELKTWQIITPPAILTALVGMIECVMTIEVIDDLSETPHLPVTQQLAAAGVANFVSGFFGTMGGGATIGLSMICIHSGANGRYRISGCVAAVFLLTIILVASPLLESVPTAALIGVMLVVVIHTFEWGSLFIVVITCMPASIRSKLSSKVSKYYEDFTTNKKIGRGDAFVIVGVTILTLIFDLAISVIFGVLFSSFWYVWQQAHECKVSKEIVNTSTVIYSIDGPLFFGNSHWIRKQFDFNDDPDNIEIHLNDASLFDYSAMQAINFIGEKYKKIDKNVKLKHLNVGSRKLITKAKDLFSHFEYESVMVVRDEGSVNFSKPDRLNVLSSYNTAD